MVKIVLEPAKNGIIKKIIDTNYSGSKETWSSLEVYEETSENNIGYVMKFFYDICEDLGINIGNKFSKEVIVINKVWGSHYEPTNEEIEAKIRSLESEINLLKECLNE